MPLLAGLAVALASFSLASGSPTSWNHGDNSGHGAPMAPAQSNAADPLVVRTSVGLVRGMVDATNPNVRQFLGVPYAKPPVGDRRWAAPQALGVADQSAGVLDATKLPRSCMQYLTTLGNSLYTRDVLEFNLQGLNRTGNVDEDCLTASIWTPGNVTVGHSQGQGAEKEGGWGGKGEWEGLEMGKGKGYGNNNGKGLPVLIFIYGGGFTTGGEDVPYQLPPQWVQRTQDHIVVSFNYRVNLFGFPNAAGLTDENVGLLDQRLAVEWIQQNIAAFGGDPNRMVLWGQSAGAMSVDFYNFAYPTNPIVTGLIMDSGTAMLPIRSVDTTHSNFSFVAANVGCGSQANAAAELACMRKVPADTLENFVARYQDSAAKPPIRFVPVVDGKTVFANYTERALKGLQANIPAIIGTNAQDGVPFAPYNPNGPDQVAAQAALLSVFFCPATRTIADRLATGRRTYRYEYAGNFTNVSPRPWMGAYHSAELPMLMGTHPNFRGPSTPLEYATSAAMQDAWVAFAADPVNGLAAQNWPVYELGTPTARVFGDGVAAQDESLSVLCVGSVDSTAV
ncbi:hypothetical protein LTR60_002937 [Cryomyces antarcticus]|nr:hypothetical protein LTR60_002937 [Cryomyces antarcticus]